MKQKIALLLGLALAFTGCNEQQSSAVAPDASTKTTSGNFIDTLKLELPQQAKEFAARSVDNPYGVGALHWAGKQYLTVQFRGKLPTNTFDVWSEVSRKWEALQDPTNPTNEFLFQVVPASTSNPKIILEFKENPASTNRGVWVTYSYDTNNGNLIAMHIAVQWYTNGIKNNWDDPNTLRPYLMAYTGLLLGFQTSDDPSGVMHSQFEWVNGAPQGHAFFSPFDVAHFNRAYNDNKPSKWQPLFTYPSKSGYAKDVAFGWDAARIAQGSTTSRLIPAGLAITPGTNLSYSPMYQTTLGLWHLPVKPGTGVLPVCEDKSGSAVGIPAGASFGLIPIPFEKNWTIQSFAFSPVEMYGTFAKSEVTGYPVSRWEVQDFLPQNTFCRRRFGAYLGFKATVMKAQ